MKRLNAGGKKYKADITGNSDITNPPVVGVNAAKNSERQVYPSLGTSKYRRPASYWTDYIASQKADYVTQQRLSNNSTVLTKTIVCSCTSNTLTPRQGICMICKNNFNNVNS
jgi:hypothetical protein